MINKLRKINFTLLESAEKTQNDKQIIVQKVIKELLAYDDCFEKLSVERAYSIFKELKLPKENWQTIYLDLTLPKN